VIQDNERGKKEPVKVGLSPVQREGVDYEPDLFFDMRVPHNDLVVSKSRCEALVPGEIFKKPDNEFADLVIDWLQDAEPATRARSLGEALSLAVIEGIAASEQNSTERYTRARQGLTAWCRNAGVAETRHDAAQAQLKQRVAEAVARARAAAAQPSLN
jgi:hypothetical protein